MSASPNLRTKILPKPLQIPGVLPHPTPVSSPLRDQHRDLCTFSSPIWIVLSLVHVSLDNKWFWVLSFRKCYPAVGSFMGFAVLIQYSISEVHLCCVLCYYGIFHALNSDAGRLGACYMWGQNSSESWSGQEGSLQEPLFAPRPIPSLRKHVWGPLHQAMTRRWTCHRNMASPSPFWSAWFWLSPWPLTLTWLRASYLNILGHPCLFHLPTEWLKEAKLTYLRSFGPEGQAILTNKNKHGHPDPAMPLAGISEIPIGHLNGLIFIAQGYLLQCCL